MSIKSYIVDHTNKIYSINHNYNGGTYNILASDNITDLMFTDDESNQVQASLYKTIKFGSNVTFIPGRCCYKFVNLNVVEFAGNKVSTIRDEAFYMCRSLQRVTIPPAVIGIGSNAFAECTSLESVVFPTTPVNFSPRAFYNTGLTSLNVTTETVSHEVFENCVKMTSATVNGAIGVYMFNGCTALKSVTVNGKVSNIPTCFLKGCTQLTSVNFTSIESITSIDNEAFYDCKSLTSFQMQDTAVTYVGGGVFYNSGVTYVILPATITSPSQVNDGFLTGSSVIKLKFNGIPASYMDNNYEEFSAFGGDASRLIIESSDGKTYRVNTDGLVIPQPTPSNPGIVPAGNTVFIISIATSDSIPNSVLPGNDKDSERFINLIQQAYADKPELIVGIKRLNDSNTPNSDGLATVESIDAAFAEAQSANAQFVIFQFSDHGGYGSSSNDGRLYVHGGAYEYSRLFQKLQMFKNVFVFLCCCYPNSASTPFTPGPNGTKALFWCCASPNQKALMQGNVGSYFLSLLIRKFNASYTWEQQWEKIHIQHSPDRLLPYQYNYGDFPVSSKVFRLGEG